MSALELRGHPALGAKTAERAERFARSLLIDEVRSNEFDDAVIDRHFGVSAKQVRRARDELPDLK